MRSAVAGIDTSATPTGARASRMAFITVGVLATVPLSPTPTGFVVLGTGLKSTLIAAYLGPGPSGAQRSAPRLAATAANCSGVPEPDVERRVGDGSEPPLPQEITSLAVSPYR